MDVTSTTCYILAKKPWNGRGIFDLYPPRTWYGIPNENRTFAQCGYPKRCGIAYIMVAKRVLYKLGNSMVG